MNLLNKTQQSENNNISIIKNGFYKGWKIFLNKHIFLNKTRSILQDNKNKTRSILQDNKNKTRSILQDNKNKTRSILQDNKNKNKTITIIYITKDSYNQGIAFLAPLLTIVNPERA
jgi:hypothetical protein